MVKILKNRIIKEICRYITLVVMLFISAVNFNLFMRPIDFVTGGTPGLAIIVEHVLKIPTNYFLYFIYIIMFIISFIILGKKSILGILIATIFYPTFVTLTTDIISYVTVEYNDFFIICLVASVINGFANGVIYKMGFASSGLGILGPIFNKCFHLSIANTNFVINTIIVSLGGFFFGIEMVLYAIIFLYLNSFVSNKVILGISSNKALLIRSEKIDEINDMLYNDYHIEGILLEVSGGYTKNEGYMSLIVIPSMKYNLIVDRIKKIDQNIFYDVLDSYELSNKILNEE